MTYISDNYTSYSAPSPLSSKEVYVADNLTDHLWGTHLWNEIHSSSPHSVVASLQPITTCCMQFKNVTKGYIHASKYWWAVQSLYTPLPIVKRYIFLILFTMYSTPALSFWFHHIYAWARAKQFGCHSVCLSVITGSHFQVIKREHHMLYGH